MRGGAVLGGVAFLLFLVSLAVQGAVQLHLNGEGVALDHPPIARGEELLVPLREFGLLLGAETATGADELTIRSPAGEESFPRDAFPIEDGVYYIPLSRLAELVGAEVHAIGDDVYVETTPVRLDSLDWDSHHVTVRFSAFSPYRMTSAAGRFVVTFHHVELGIAPLDVSVTGGPVRRVSLAPGRLGTAVLTVETTPGSVPATKRFTAPGFYSVTLSFDHRARSESQAEISPWITYHEITTDLGAGPVEIRYLYIEDWASHFKLAPAIPETGVGTLADLADLARAGGATAAINANFYDTATNDPVGLLIVNGVILSSNYKRRAALGIDLFGRLTFFNPQVSIYLRTQAGKIAVDDVNRPITADGVVAFTPGYAGPMRTGIGGETFRVVKIKNDRVVSAYTAPYIAADPTAVVIVGTGAGRTRLAPIAVGDEASLEYTLDQGDPLITDAVSAGPLLISAGKDALNPQAEGFSPGSYLVSGRAARSVLAVDQLGGLILLVVTKGAASVGANFQDLLTILHGLSIPVRDAIAFDGGHSSSLVFKDRGTYREVGSGGKVAVGLLLIPRENK